MAFLAGHADGCSLVHLTHTSLVVDALCGADVVFLGEPAFAVICEDCDRLARARGGRAEEWRADAVIPVPLLVAA